MANGAYLLAVSRPETTWSKNPSREILAEGINEIPAFWASLFRPQDRRADPYSGNCEVTVANWLVKSETAKRRLEELKQPMLKLLDDNAHRLWTQWLKFISGCRTKFFKTNAVEVWALDPDGYEAYCRKLLRAFARPSKATMSAALEANGLGFAKREILSSCDLDTTLCKLAGANHIRKLPWFAKFSANAYSFSDVPGNERRTVYDEIYDAVSARDSLDDAIRKARAILEGFDGRRRRRRR